MTLNLLRNTGQEFCRMLLNSDLSNSFLMIRLWLCILGEKTKKVKHPHHLILESMCNWHDDTLHHQAMVLFAGFSLVKWLLIHLLIQFFGSKPLILAPVICIWYTCWCPIESLSNCSFFLCACVCVCSSDWISVDLSFYNLYLFDANLHCVRVYSHIWIIWHDFL